MQLGNLESPTLKLVPVVGCHLRVCDHVLLRRVLRVSCWCLLMHLVDHTYPPFELDCRYEFLYETHRADMLWVVIINIPYTIMPVMLWWKLLVCWPSYDDSVEKKSL